MVKNRNAYNKQLIEQLKGIEKKSDIKEPTFVEKDVERIKNHFCKFPIPDKKDSEEEKKTVLEEYRQFRRLLIKIKHQINRKGKNQKYLAVDNMDINIKDVEEVINLLKENIVSDEEKRSKKAYKVAIISIFIAILSAIAAIVSIIMVFR
ncbi:hypothetical protein ES705_28683 [subsurface metagenome]|jgi:hypothetical protein